MTSIAKQLLNIQIQQLEHDENFHKEITFLNTHQKINHMTLHFAKYAGKICSGVLNANDKHLLDKTVIDAFIISIACANILNVRLSDALMPASDYGKKKLPDLIGDITSNLKINTNEPLWLLKTYPVVVGELAKACEAIDHLEDYDFRKKIVDCAVRISSLMLIAAQQLEIDLLEAVPLRLAGVKNKSIFYYHEKHAEPVEWLSPRN